VIETAKSLIAKAWKETRVQKPRRGLVAAYAGQALRLNNANSSIAFQNHLELFDEFITWLVDLQRFCCSARPISKKKITPTRIWHLRPARSRFQFAIKCVSGMTSLREYWPDLSHNIRTSWRYPWYSLPCELNSRKKKILLIFGKSMSSEEKPEQFWRSCRSRGALSFGRRNMTPSEREAI
jgi:hypothetical protein